MTLRFVSDAHKLYSGPVCRIRKPPAAGFHPSTYSTQFPCYLPVLLINETANAKYFLFILAEYDEPLSNRFNYVRHPAAMERAALCLSQGQVRFVYRTTQGLSLFQLPVVRFANTLACAL